MLMAAGSLLLMPVLYSATRSASGSREEAETLIVRQRFRCLTDLVKLVRSKPFSRMVVPLIILNLSCACYQQLLTIYGQHVFTPKLYDDNLLVATQIFMLLGVFLGYFNYRYYSQNLGTHLVKVQVFVLAAYFILLVCTQS